MKLQCTWNSKMKFIAEAGRHQVQMDTKTPIGDDSALSPKQLLLAAISGCTAMDVVALLKKHKQPLESLQIEADATSTEGTYPPIFKEVHLLFKLKGPVDSTQAIDAVALSQTKYCGVSAMISKSVKISYTIELNGKNIGTGHADFALN